VSLQLGTTAFMSSTPSRRAVLDRGGEIISADPTTEAVIQAMDVVFAEDGMHGPPELALEFRADSTPGGEPAKRLLMMLAFRSERPAAWLIDYSIPKTPGPTFLLAAGDEHREQFERRACCGVISEYRSECLIYRKSVLRPAIEWFLEHESPCPTLTWINYSEAVRDADNSYPA
jgi:hypothetical protein